MPAGLLHRYKYPATATPIMMMDIHCRNISDSVSFMPFVMVASHAALGSFLSASVISAPLDFLLAMVDNELV